MNIKRARTQRRLAKKLQRVEHIDPVEFLNKYRLTHYIDIDAEVLKNGIAYQEK